MALHRPDYQPDCAELRQVVDDLRQRGLVTGKVRTTFIARPTGITSRGVAAVFPVFVLVVLLSMAIHVL